MTSTLGMSEKMDSATRMFIDVDRQYNRLVKQEKGFKICRCEPSERKLTKSKGLKSLKCLNCDKPFMLYWKRG